MRRPLCLALPLALFGLGCSSHVEPVAEPLPSGLSPAGCTGPGWCWVRGAPVLVKEDRGAPYAAGLAGRLLVWKADRWEDRSLQTTRAVQSAWLGGPDNQWVSDDQGAVWHRDGKSFREVPPNRQIVRLQGTADGTLFAVAAPDEGAHGASIGGHLLRRDGDAWVEPAPPAEYCFPGTVVALAHDDFWSTGLYCDDKDRTVKGGEVRRWDGASWQLVGERFPGLSWYTRLAVVNGRVRFNDGFEWDGKRWAPLEGGDRGYPQGLPLDISPVWTGSDYLLTPRWLGCDAALRLDDKRALCWGRGQIHLWDGATFTPTLPDPFAATAAPERFTPLPTELWAGSDTVMAWGATPDDVYRVRGSTGQKLERFDGEAWKTVGDKWVIDLDGSRGEPWFPTQEGLFWISAEQTEPVPSPIDPPDRDPAGSYDDQVRSVRVLAPRLALLASGRRLRLYEDGNWSVLRDAPDRHFISDVAGTSLGDIYLLEKETGRSNTFWLYHFDGAAWSEIPVEGLTYTASLDTWGDETWLSTRDVIVNLATGKRYELYQWTSGEPTRLRVDSAGLWVTTAHQARWHAR